MSALAYGQTVCPKKVLSFLKRIGEGFHGEVYLLPDDKVIKYSLVSQNMIDDLVNNFFSRLEEVIKYQQENNYPCFVKILDFGLLSSAKRDTEYGEEDVLFYQTTMEKLNLISVDEKKLFKTIVRQHRDVKSPWNKIIKDVREQSHWLDFNLEKVISFIHLIEDSPIVHDDISSSNILKDNNGNFKLIDLDFSRLKD